MSKPLSLGFSNSNYYQFNSQSESLNLVTASGNLNSRLSATLGLGVDINSKPNPSANANSTAEDLVSTSYRPALEAKVKYNVTDNLNAQLRYRRRGDTDQCRVTFGGSYKFDNHNSIYSSAHLTVNRQDKLSANTGGWLGYTHKFDNGVSISAEAQVNASVDKPLKESLSDKGNYMINTMINIPF